MIRILHNLVYLGLNSVALLFFQMKRRRNLPDTLQIMDILLRELMRSPTIQ